MSTSTAEVRQLEQLLQQKLITWISSGAPLYLFDTPPQSPFPSEMSCEKYTPLPAGQFIHNLYPQVTYWKEHFVNSISVIVLGCIFEGEAQYRVIDSQPDTCKKWVIPLKAKSFFLISPNTPFSNGARVPWETHQPENAYSRGLLMYLRRDGVEYVSFTCDKGKLWLHPYIFIYQLEAEELGHKLLKQMRQKGGTSHPISYLYWQLILRLLLQSIQNNHFTTLKQHRSSLFEGDLPQPGHLSSSQLVANACAYIKDNLGNPELTTRQLSQHSGLSLRHLNRLFKKELNQSVFHFIQQERLKKTCDLLSHSNISLTEIAAYCGFPHLSAFSSWFTRTVGKTPSQFRKERKR